MIRPHTRTAFLIDQQQIIPVQQRPQHKSQVFVRFFIWLNKRQEALGRLFPIPPSGLSHNPLDALPPGPNKLTCSKMNLK